MELLIYSLRVGASMTADVGISLEHAVPRDSSRSPSVVVTKFR